jgi:exodeoxyribonuclease-3
VRIATYNVNGINGRLPVLLRWLEAAKPDIACLQELKAPDEKFPASAIEKAGYGAIWHGQQRWNGVAILSRGCEPVETRRGLPGDPGDTHSRYVEAAVRGLIIGCLYLPNGNPRPGPKFDYKMRWIERFEALAAELVGLGGGGERPAGLGPAASAGAALRPGEAPGRGGRGGRPPTCRWRSR